MAYEWMTKTAIKHSELGQALEYVVREDYEIVAIPQAGFSPAGEPLVTLVAKRKLKGKKRKQGAPMA